MGSGKLPGSNTVWFLSSRFMLNLSLFCLSTPFQIFAEYLHSHSKSLRSASITCACFSSDLLSLDKLINWAANLFMCHLKYFGGCEKDPGSVLHLLVLSCNCRSYYDNIGP